MSKLLSEILTKLGATRKPWEQTKLAQRYAAGAIAEGYPFYDDTGTNTHAHGWATWAGLDMDEMSEEVKRYETERDAPTDDDSPPLPWERGGAKNR